MKRPLYLENVDKLFAYKEAVKILLRLGILPSHFKDIEIEARQLEDEELITNTEKRILTGALPKWKRRL